MKRKSCITCKYGSWLFAKLYPKEADEKCSKCSAFTEWVKVAKTDTDIESIRIMMLNR